VRRGRRSCDVIGCSYVRIRLRCCARASERSSGRSDEDLHRQSIPHRMNGVMRLVERYADGFGQPRGLIHNQHYKKPISVVSISLVS